MPSKWVLEEGQSISEETVEEATKLYNEYAQSKVGFIPPTATISITPKHDGSSALKVHMEIEYKGNNFYFDSVEKADAKEVYKYLTSQPLVCEKYATKKTSTEEETEQRVAVLSDRFDPKSVQAEKGFFMHGGFKVTDKNGTFLGLVNTGASTFPGFTEIGVRFRADAWSHRPENLHEAYNIPDEDFLDTPLEGAGTAAVCALWSYTMETAKKIKKNEEVIESQYPILGKSIEGMRAVSQIANDGGWKALCNAGMELSGVDTVAAYGPEIRFQTYKLIPS